MVKVPEVAIAEDVRMRLLRPTDAPLLAGAYVKNRRFLAPWEPERPEEFYSSDGQQPLVAATLQAFDDGLSIPWILEAKDRIVGRISLNDIPHGAVCRPFIGYWLDEAFTGRGLATQAVRQLALTARTEAGLHRLEAATRLENAASQRVLAKAGFSKIGIAHKYFRIDGDWRDHILFERIL